MLRYRLRRHDLRRQIYHLRQQLCMLYTAPHAEYQAADAAFFVTFRVRRRFAEASVFRCSDAAAASRSS